MSSRISQCLSQAQGMNNAMNNWLPIHGTNGNDLINQLANIYAQNYQYYLINGTNPHYTPQNTINENYGNINLLSSTLPVENNLSSLNGIGIPDPNPVMQETLVAQIRDPNLVIKEALVAQIPDPNPVIPKTPVAPEIEITSETSIIKNNRSSVNGVEHVQKKHRNGTKSKKRSSNIDLSILIKFFNIDKDDYYQIIDNSIHDVYYRVRKIINGEVKGCINYAGVLKIISGIKYMSVTTIIDKTREKLLEKEYDLKKEGNESNEIIVPLKTNGKCNELNKKCEKTVMLSFKDEKKVVRLRIYLKLRDSKTEERRINKESKDNKKSKNCKTLEIINGFIENYREENEETLVNSVRLSLKVMLKTLLKELKKEISDKKMDYLMDNYHELYNNPENETYAKFRNIIFTIDKNDERKKELLKLCFKALYNYVMDHSIDNSEKKYFDNPTYIEFIKEYSNGKTSQNDIVITKDIAESKGRKRKIGSINENENENEELQKRKKQIIEMDRNITLRTDK